MGGNQENPVEKVKRVIGAGFLPVPHKGFWWRQYEPYTEEGAVPLDDVCAITLRDFKNSAAGNMRRLDAETCIYSPDKDKRMNAVVEIEAQQLIRDIAAEELARRQNLSVQP